MTGVALVTTLHDPEGRMVEAASRLTENLAGLYESVSVAPTPWTSPRLVDALSPARVEIRAESAGAIGTGRRHALRMGLESGATHLHYCDFDRILHWLGSFPDEIPSPAREDLQYDFLIVGRTERAFLTHPRVQIDTESITNHAFSLWHGEPVDVTAGSCGLSRRAAELLSAPSTVPTNATDAEWPGLIKQAGMRVGFVQMEGLEFETPDYFRDEVEAAGSQEAWVEERSRPLDGWVSRTRLTLESLEAIERVARG